MSYIKFSQKVFWPLCTVLVSVATVNASSITPLIGGNGTLNADMTTDVTVSSMTTSTYRLYVYKGDKGARPGSWNAFCDNHADTYLMAVTNIENSNPPYLSSTDGSVSVLDDSSPGNIQLRFNIQFTEEHPNPPGATLIYALFALTPERESTAINTLLCGTNFLTTSAYAVKGPFAVVNNGGGGGTTPVTVADPNNVGDSLNGQGNATPTVSGVNYDFLRNLFGNGNNAGSSDVAASSFPVVRVVISSLLYLAGLFLLLGVIYSGIILLRATSDEEAAAAKKNLVWLLTGSLVVISANWIVWTVINFIK